jgi:deoxyribodipyrimidine photo-lyase
MYFRRRNPHNRGMDWWGGDARIAIRRGGEPARAGRCVVYWMQRAQREFENPALEVAIRSANELRMPVAVFFGLLTTHPVANLRHYTFMVEGLVDTAARLKRRGIGFYVRAVSKDGPARTFAKFCADVNAAMAVTDENPLRHSARWREEAARIVRIPMLSVDADAIVPSVLMQREQYAARTIRPRIHSLLSRYLKPVSNAAPTVSWKSSARLRSLQLSMNLLGAVKVDPSVPPAPEIRGGTSQGLAALRRFVGRRLIGYASLRNRPELDATSQLSPYLHFGHVGPHTVAITVTNADAPARDREAFLEEMIVRRELAINFVRHNRNYDRLQSCEPWALKTLTSHAEDLRPYIYTYRQLERAETHDPLWNAAQTQMVRTGWMHGYLRMYWAKKILEWSRSAAEAFRAAVRLNDRFELDGRDPNGYAGIAWAIGGKNDRAWGPQRPIYGMIRYMSFQSTSRKFDSRSYITQWNGWLVTAARHARERQSDSA